MGRMSGWMRRNAVPLVALAVLAPATVLAIGWHEWSETFTGTAWRPVTAQPGGQVVVAGVTVGPATLSEAAPGAELDVPAGARGLVLEVTVTPGDAPLTCQRPTLIERETGREWQSTSLPPFWEGDASCFEVTAPVTFRLPYIVPADAGALMAELSVLDSGDQLPRLLLDAP